MKSAPAHAVLLLGLVCVSTAAPFLIMAKMGAYAVVFWRMALSAGIFLGWAATRGELTRVAVGQRARLVAGALFLAAHFALWVKAFDLTDYSSNLLLLVAQPATAAVMGRAIGERQGRAMWISIALAVAGLAIIAGGDFALGPRALLGDAMCIAGGLAIATFYLVTREVRAETPLATFMGLTFLVGALAILPLAAATSRLFDYPAASWRWLAALVLCTTVAGHGLMNLAARHVTLFTLNIVIVLEPAIGIGLGALLFGAPIRPAVVVGGVVLAASVVVGLRTARTPVVD